MLVQARACEHRPPAARSRFEHQALTRVSRADMGAQRHGPALRNLRCQRHQGLHLLLDRGAAQRACGHVPLAVRHGHLRDCVAARSCRSLGRGAGGTGSVRGAAPRARRSSPPPCSARFRRSSPSPARWTGSATWRSTANARTARCPGSTGRPASDPSGSSGATGGPQQLMTGPGAAPACAPATGQMTIGAAGEALASITDGDGDRSR